MDYSDNVYKVSFYSDEYESIKKITIITSVTVYTSSTGESYI